MKKATIYVSALLGLFAACQHDYKNPFDTKVNLSKVYDFTAKPEGEGIRLDWKTTDRIKTGCRIERWTESQNSDSAQILTVVYLPELSYLDTAITTDLLTYYRITGFSDLNETVLSRIASAKVSFPVPSGLVATGHSDSSITVRWNAGTDFESYYYIDRMSTGDSSWTTIAESISEEFTDTGVEMNRIYYYRIRAVSDRNMSAPSQTVEITLTLAAPSGLQVIQDQRELRLSWTDNAQFETGYTVQIVADGQTDTTKVTLSPDAQMFELPALDENTKYRCTITAFTEKYRSESLTETLSYVRSFTLDRSLTGQSGGIASLCFFDNDRYLAGGSQYNDDVTIWSTETWEPVNTVSGIIGSQVAAIGFVPGNDLVIGQTNGTVKIWNVFSWNETALLNLNNYPLYDLLYAESQERLVAAQYKYLYVWSSADWSYQKTLSGHTGNINTLAALPDQDLLVSAGEDGMHLWSMKTWMHLQTVPGISETVTTLCFSTNGDLLAYDDPEGRINLLNTGDWSNFRTMTVSGSPADLLFTPDDNWLICAGTTLTAWFTDGYEEKQILASSLGPFRTLKYASNGSWLAAGTSDGKIRILLPAGTWKIL